MAITKELVLLMKGKIEATSNPGEGTTFSLSLPIKGRGKQTQKPFDNQTVVNLSALSILLVDDVPTNTLVCQALLAPHFAKVKTAAYAKETINMLAEESFDLLITDIGMPHMSGEELMAITKQRFANLPVIALTGNASKTDQAHYLSIGFDGAIAKPINANELLALIHSIFFCTI